MDPELKSILIAADERGQYEFPQHFDAVSLEKRARQVHREILGSGYVAGFEDWTDNQDASFGLAITVDSFQVSGAQGIRIPTIRFSNFGSLASLTWQDLVDEQFLTVAKDTLNKHGFIFVPQAELEVPYDGPNSPDESLPSWWVRYFDWL
jgi:hypothetical protein